MGFLWHYCIHGGWHLCLHGQARMFVRISYKKKCLAELSFIEPHKKGVGYGDKNTL